MKRKIKGKILHFRGSEGNEYDTLILLEYEKVDSETGSRRADHIYKGHDPSSYKYEKFGSSFSYLEMIKILGDFKGTGTISSVYARRGI